MDTDNVDIAKIEVKGFKMYQIKKDITDAIIMGEQGTQYKDHESFNNVSISRSLEKGLFEDLAAKHIIRKQDVYSFDNGVDYKRSDGISFFSAKGVLNAKTEVFHGKGDFLLRDSQGVVRGRDIVFDKKNEKLLAQNIRAKIHLEEKR